MNLKKIFDATNSHSLSRHIGIIKRVELNLIFIEKPYLFLCKIILKKLLEFKT